MGSPLPPIVANLFMEELECKALSSALFQPKLWKRFVDHTCVIQPHGKEELDRFFLHLNSQYCSIKFTMEYEVDGSLPFLDVLISRKGDGSFSDQFF